MPAVACVPVLVAVETDPARFYSEHGHRPRLPSAEESEQILAHVTADLTGMFPTVTNCHLATGGALLDPCQVIRPGFPVLTALKQTVLARAGQHQGPPWRITIGSQAGDAGDARLQPDPSISPGLLQVLPLTLGGKPKLIGELDEAMEHRFIEQGQLSAHSAKALENAFGIGVTHARFMTLTDLLAMLRLQLEHFGFLPLWELVDAAAHSLEEELTITSQLGQQFRYRDGAVRARFETFDCWAHEGSGRELPANADELARAYLDWLLEFRQYVTTLQAHAITVDFEPACIGAFSLHEGYLVEESCAQPRTGSFEITEHNDPELGVIAVSAFREGRQFNYYPLNAAGIDRLQQALERSGLGTWGFSRTGRLLLDAQNRCLSIDLSGGEAV